MKEAEDYTRLLRRYRETEGNDISISSFKAIEPKLVAEQWLFEEITFFPCHAVVLPPSLVYRWGYLQDYMPQLKLCIAVKQAKEDFGRLGRIRQSCLDEHVSW